MNKVINVYEDKKAIPFNNLWFLCKIGDDRLRAKVLKDKMKGFRNFVKRKEEHS